MKNKKILAIVLAVCMTALLMPVMTFAETSTEKAHQSDARYYGDAMYDGALNTADATAILKYCAEITQFTEAQLGLTNEGFAKVDANKDGKTNSADATYVLKVCVGTATANTYYDMIPDMYKVTYASGLPENVDVVLPMESMVEEETEFQLTEAATAEGYIFKAWKTDEQTYNLGDSFTMPSHDVVLTGVWEQDEEAPLQPGQARVTVNYYDIFNEANVVSGKLIVNDGENTVTASDVKLPGGYKLYNSDFSVKVTVQDCIAKPSSITVNIYPFEMKDGEEFMVILANKGFDKMNMDMTANYLLGTDLDLSGTNRYPFGWCWEDLTQDDTSFTGVFDGNGHVINNLYIDHTNNYASVAGTGEMYDFYSNVGLFACNEGIIRNVTVFTKEFDGTSYEYGVFGDVNVGVIAGKNIGTIENCHVNGNAGSMDYIEMDRGACGGITGHNTGTVTKCSFEGGVEGFYWIGGLIGKNYGTLEESYFAGGINSGLDQDIAYYYSVRYIGGLCGGASGATVKNCYVMPTADIFGDKGVGGMIGWISGGNLENIYITNGAYYIVCLTDYSGSDVGYIAQAPKHSGIYLSENDTINGGVLPKEFPVDIWDMNGVCFEQAPDLINNRRTSEFFED